MRQSFPRLRERSARPRMLEHCPVLRSAHQDGRPRSYTALPPSALPPFRPSVRSLLHPSATHSADEIRGIESRIRRRSSRPGSPVTGIVHITPKSEVPSVHRHRTNRKRPSSHVRSIWYLSGTAASGAYRRRCTPSDTTRYTSSSSQRSTNGPHPSADTILRPCNNCAQAAGSPAYHANLCGCVAGNTSVTVRTASVRVNWRASVLDSGISSPARFFGAPGGSDPFGRSMASQCGCSRTKSLFCDRNPNSWDFLLHLHHDQYQTAYVK